MSEIPQSTHNTHLFVTSRYSVVLNVTRAALPQTEAQKHFTALTEDQTGSVLLLKDRDPMLFDPNLQKSSQTDAQPLGKLNFLYLEFF